VHDERQPDGSRAGCAEPSAPVEFRKSSPKLALTTPAHRAPVGGSEVVLSWQGFSAALSAATGSPATSEAYAYRVQVARPDNPDFAKAGLIEDVRVDSTHHVSADLRYAEGPHLWRVQPVDASGHRLPWSATRTFTRDSIAPTFRIVPTLLPARGSFTVRFSEPVVGVGPSTVVLSAVPSRVTASADRLRAVVAPTRPLLPGASHTVTVGLQVQDLAGNRVSPSGWVSWSTRPSTTALGAGPVGQLAALRGQQRGRPHVLAQPTDGHEADLRDGRPHGSGRRGQGLRRPDLRDRRGVGRRGRAARVDGLPVLQRLRRGPEPHGLRRARRCPPRGAAQHRAEAPPQRGDDGRRRRRHRGALTVRQS
jgi:hypothetical protein